jgi:putative glutamine amidotransferase
MRIGIPLSSSKTQYYVNQAYVQYVAESGLDPVIIPPELPVDIALASIDGLLLPGGIDLDPIFYGEDNYTSYSVDPEKDEFERKLFHVARNANIPIFGICRGFQLIAREYMEYDDSMNEFLEFDTHITSHNQVSDQTLARSIHQHFVDYVPAVLYSGDNQVESMPVNSMHHQCLVADFKRRGVLGARAFRMGAWTTRGLKIKSKKGSYPVVCEAFRILKWGAPILAVQWHPEEIRDHELLRQFFNTGGQSGKGTMEAT